MSDEYAFMDATAQAELVRTGDVTPAELVDAAIARIESVNPQLNAVIIKLYDKARAAAASALPDGPFRGVPFLLKDAVAHSAGDPYHCGMQVLKDAGWVEPADTWLVERYRAAGFVIVGKTNLPELATSVTTEPLAYGATHNPWDLDHSPGGSSGGAGSAVASGMVPVAHGNDMGGSIRIPASECGIVGLKPSRGRNTLGPDFGEYWAMTTHEHVLTRSVRDTAAVLDATAGPGTGDPYTAPPPARPFAAEVGADPGRLRIGFRTRRRDGNESDPECVAAVRETAALLESLGHDVEAVDLPALDDPRFEEAVSGIFGVFILTDLERWSRKLGRELKPSDLDPWNQAFCEAAANVTGVQYANAIERGQSYARDVAQWWADGWDVLVTPQLTTLPPRLGELAPDNDPARIFARISGMTDYTMPFNVTGQPAVSLPLHWSAGGLPVGVQFVAAYGREDLLLRLAGQLEQARPWADRRPPVSA
jgi:amidase